MFNLDLVKLDILERKNTRHGRRYITPQGEQYPSVTTAISWSTKDAIAEWRQRIGFEEADKITRIATTRGTAIHNLCENALRNQPEDTSNLSLLDQEMYSEFRPLLNDITNIRALEQPLYSDHLRLAGQPDCIAEYNGRLSVIDFKTSKNRKKKEYCKNYFVQCTAYAIMFEERTGIPVDQIVILMAQENDGPVVYVEKRDNYVEDLIKIRDAYERELYLVSTDGGRFEQYLTSIHETDTPD